MKNVLVVVDVQNDFVNGTLGSKEAEAIIPNVIEAIENEKYDTIIALQDTHGKDYLETYEGQHLPVEHCIKDSEGWMIQKDVLKALKKRKATFIEKDTFSTNKLLDVIDKNEVESVTVCGLCTDICVVATAMLLRVGLNGIPIRMIKEAMAGTTKEKHQEAIDVMASCQIEEETL